MELKELQAYATYLTLREGWQDETIETRLNYLKSEVEEVQVEVFNYSRAQTEEEQDKVKQDLGSELFDILWNVSELANRYGIDLEEASRRKIVVNNNRTFSKKPLLEPTKPEKMLK